MAVALSISSHADRVTRRSVQLIEVTDPLRPLTAASTVYNNTTHYSGVFADKNAALAAVEYDPELHALVARTHVDTRGWPE